MGPFVSLESSVETPVAPDRDQYAIGFLVFNASSLDMSETDSKAYSNMTFSRGHGDSDWSIFRRSPWTVGLNSSGHQMFALSYCCTTSIAYDLNVTMNGSSLISEPTIEWNASLASSTSGINFNTTQIRTQLGATLQSLDLQARGILALDFVPRDDGTSWSSGAFSRMSREGLFMGENTIALSTVHELHKKIFLDILRDTEDPALAVQALSTIFFQMDYYDAVYKWGEENSVGFVSLRDTSIPIGRAGLYTVIALVSVYSMILGATLLLFLHQTEATSIGNVWQSVAQLLSNDTLPILARVDAMRDKEVREMLRDSDGGQKSAGVIRRRRNGRNQFGAICTNNES